MSTPSVSLLDPAVIECPFPAYQDLRERCPVLEMSPGMFLVSRYEDVLAVLKDTKTFSSMSGGSGFTTFGPSPVQDEIDAIIGDYPEIPTLLNNDPPDQTRLRSLVNRVFTPREVKALEPSISAIVDELARPWAGRGRVEFVAEFSQPLPSAVIAAALGAEPAMSGRLQFWSDEIMSRVSVQQAPQRQLEVARNIAAMNDYFLTMIRERREAPRDDLMSLLVNARLDDGTALRDVEIINIAVTFLVGGHETTTSLLGSIFYRFATEPELADRIRSNPAEIPALVEEILRLESPAQTLPRWTTRDTEIAGVGIPAGSTVFVMFGSANRDDTVFPRAAELDLRHATNTAGRHLAFSHGAHFCLGAQLARTEVRLALEALLPRMADIALDPDGRVERTTSMVLRGFQRLDLTFRPL